MVKMTALCSERFFMSGGLLLCGKPNAMLLLKLSKYDSRPIITAATNKPSEFSR